MTEDDSGEPLRPPDMTGQAEKRKRRCGTYKLDVSTFLVLAVMGYQWITSAAICHDAFIYKATNLYVVGFLFTLYRRQCSIFSFTLKQRFVPRLLEMILVRFVMPGQPLVITVTTSAEVAIFHRARHRNAFSYVSWNIYYVFTVKTQTTLDMDLATLIHLTWSVGQRGEE